MLIESHRHTCEDLEAWNEREQVDSLMYRDISTKSIDNIRSFVTGKKGYIGVSWGKDSVVLAHLAFLSGISWPMVWIKSPAHNPDCLRVRDSFLGKFDINYHEICVSQADNDAGRGFLGASYKFGECYMSGVRADESGIRRLSMRYHGISTKKTCRPIGWWLTQDIFSYLSIHNLPVHPTYAMTGGGRWDRDRLRVSSVGGENGTERGRRDWEREYYPDILNRVDYKKNCVKHET